jgi:hypothetical protein
MVVRGSPLGHHFRRLNSVSAFHMPFRHYKHAEHNTHHIGGHQESKPNMFILSFCSHDTLPEGTGTLKSPFLSQKSFSRAAVCRAYGSELLHFLDSVKAFHPLLVTDMD